jgi:hypothetical protein
MGQVLESFVGLIAYTESINLYPASVTPKKGFLAMLFPGFITKEEDPVAHDLLFAFP